MHVVSSREQCTALSTGLTFTTSLSRPYYTATHTMTSTKEDEYFTPEWRRPIRSNDFAPSLLSSPFWHQYPCLVCGVAPAPVEQRQPQPQREHHKRCSRCHSTVYCSVECQRHDYGEGKHKAQCNALSKLWEEKERLERRLWGLDKSSSDNAHNKDSNRSKPKSTNPFDDDSGDYGEDPTEQRTTTHEYPIVGSFWHDQPQTTMQKHTTHYCVVLIQLVQLLGRFVVPSFV
jgi:hypothetical protein